MVSGCVLVVDDDDTIRELLRDVVRMAGYTVETASDGAEALRILLQADQPWIVLLDIMMPHMSGLELCSRLMAAGGVAATHRILLMTAGRIPEGDPPPPARAVLTKPFELSNLLDVVAQLAHTDQAESGDAHADAEARYGSGDHRSKVA
jgi:CheY-like chemotaxis protein